MNQAGSFEEKLKLADEILAKLNKDDVSLEDSLALYKDGLKLLKEARKILQDAKLSINEVESDE